VPMRFSWRTDEAELASHASWVDHIDAKNRRPGTSAPTLAASWSGPLDLLGALATHPALNGLTINRVTVEAKARFDAYAGNVRNHDLVLHGVTAAGELIVVCGEAKAGERLGATVAEQAQAAQKAKQDNPRSQAVERLNDLVARLCRYPPDDERVLRLRYQLLTAWAGTLTDAGAGGISHAVFVLHEFRTDQRPDDKSLENRDELDLFAEVVLGCELPARPTPWCVAVPDVAGVAATLYVAHVLTDLRADALAAP
jgi:hypothetical protein